MLHVICTRLSLGHFSVSVGDSSRRCEEIVRISNCAFECNHYKYQHKHRHSCHQTFQPAKPHTSQHEMSYNREDTHRWHEATPGDGEFCFLLGIICNYSSAKFGHSPPPPPPPPTYPRPSSLSSPSYTLTSSPVAGVDCFVCWLLNVPATCECISGTDLLRQFYVLPH